MQVIKNEGSVPIKAWVGSHKSVGFELLQGDTHPDIEDGAMRQLFNTAKLPFLHKNGLAAMADVHWGTGSTVGSVIATKGAIIPAAVGVDFGCGMVAIRLSLKGYQLPDSLYAARMAIQRDIPLGPGGAHSLNEDTKAQFYDSFMKDSAVWDPAVAMLERVVGSRERGMHKAASQLGTLGSGNHFIELCLDEEDSVWVMLHSGSRGIGNIIGTYFIDLAKKDMEDYFINLPDKNLAYFTEKRQNFHDYVHAMLWAQNYAFENRRVMMEKVLAALKRHIPTEWAVTDEAINCHHNYAVMENHFGENLWITRKGAVRAREGDLGIIPGARGARSYIVRGKGNKESYCSCSHGAGRVMSRGEARKRFTEQDLIEQSAGIECDTNPALIDEIRDAYKPIDVVMENQRDLVEPIHTLRAVMNIKGV